MSDNMNDIIPDAEVHLSKEDKIKAIKRSVKKSANDWDGERSAMFSLFQQLPLLRHRPQKHSDRRR